MLAGVPRCIFGNFEGYKRALEIANSPNIGYLPLLRDLARRRQAAHGQGPGGDDPTTSAPREDLENPLPQRQRAAAAFRRDLHGRRLLRHVEDHEGASRRQVRRHRDPRPQPDDGRRQLHADRVRLRLHEGAAEPRQRRSVITSGVFTEAQEIRRNRELLSRGPNLLISWVVSSAERARHPRPACLAAAGKPAR